jgi:hypothetical protein
MSLYSIRRERRREGFGGPKRPPSLWKMLAALVLVIVLFWYLGRFV